jgi:hypothetical protein
MAEIRQENDSESSDVDILEVSLDNLSIEGKLNEFYTIFMTHLPVFTACVTYMYSDSIRHSIMTLLSLVFISPKINK